MALRMEAIQKEEALAISSVWAELLQCAQGSRRRASSLARLNLHFRQEHGLYPKGQAICRHYAEQGTTSSGIALRLAQMISESPATASRLFPPMRA